MTYILSSIIIIFIILLNYLMVKLFKRRSINKLLLLCIWTAIIIWYCIPSLIAAIYRENTPFIKLYLLKSNSNDSEISWFKDFLISFSIESLALVLLLASLWLFFKQKKSPNSQNAERLSTINTCTLNLSGFQKKIILFSFGYSLLYVALTYKGDYLSANSADLYGAGDSLLGLIDGIIKPLTYSMVCIIAIYENKHRSIVITSFILILLESLYTASLGGRINMLACFIIYLFRKVILEEDISINFGANFSLSNINMEKIVKTQVLKKKKKLLLNFIIVAALIWFLFLPFAQIIQSARGTERINILELLSDSYSDSINSKKSEAKSSVDSIESTLFIKLDSFTPGSLLVSESGIGNGGITPYIGSILTVIPRNIFPDKPIAGTSDGTILSHPSRIVPISLGVISDSLNLGVSPVHVTLWQLGYVGFPFFLIATLLNLKLLNKLMNKNSFIKKSLCLYTMNIPSFATVFPSPDVVIKNILFIMILIGIINFTKIFKQKKRLKAT